VKCVCFSDTHMKHKELTIPDGDALIFAGDMCGQGRESSARKFARWMGEQPHKHKIVIAGNHDRCFEQGCRLPLKKYFSDQGLIYLEHEPIAIEGIKFFGSPYTPWFMSWAFNVKGAFDLRRKWSFIPEDTEVLITHGPPFQVLDTSYLGQNCGCQHLGIRIKDLLKLKVHVFGHIHFSYGAIELNNVLYLNCCSCGEDYNITNPCLTFDV